MDIPQKTETKSEALEREITRLYKFIADEEATIERAKKNIHWDKKRLKLAQEELLELKESSVETLQDISKNLK